MDVVQSGPITRRGLLENATTALALALVGNIGLANGASAEPNPIQKENAHEGSTDWQLTRTRVDKVDGCRCRDIEGYCSKQSVVAGERLQIMVSTQPASKYQIEIFRTGYYGGRGARLIRGSRPHHLRRHKPSARGLSKSPSTGGIRPIGDRHESRPPSMAACPRHPLTHMPTPRTSTGQAGVCIISWRCARPPTSMLGLRD